MGDADLTIRFAALRSLAEFDGGAFERAAATALGSALLIWINGHRPDLYLALAAVKSRVAMPVIRDIVRMALAAEIPTSR